MYESQRLHKGLLYRKKETEEERVNVHGDAACFFFFSWAKQEEAVFLGIIRHLDQYWCYDETVIEFVV